MAKRGLGREIYDLALHNGRQRFFPMSGPAYRPLHAFGIINAGHSRHRPPFEICRMNFSQHSAYFCISGRACYVTPNGEGVIGPGEIWTVPSNYPHRYWTDSEWAYVWVHFRDVGHWRTWTGGVDAKRPAHRIDLIAQVAESMLDHGDRWRDEEIMEVWAKLFVLYVGRELFGPNDLASKWHARLSAVWREVRIDPARIWRIADLAYLAHMSPTQFNRAMRSVYEMPANDMLTRIRLENAMELMRATDMKLEKIAELSGYSTGFALSKAFRRLFGMSPRQMARGALPLDVAEVG